MVRERLAALAIVAVFATILFWAIPTYAVDTVTSATVSSSTVIDKAPPTASSPSIVVNNSDICQTGTSAALQTGFFGLSGGTTVVSTVCQRLRLARAVYGMGLKVAGISLLCQDKRVWDALWMAGTPCPFQGAIGDAAKAQWLADPERAPEGSMIRVARDEAAAEEVAATEYPEDEEMYE